MHPLKIIIIDDEQRIRSSIKNVLRLHYPSAVVVAEAENVSSAIKVIQEHSPDVILLDIKMPGESGFDLLKKIEPLNFKIIFITAFDQYAIQAFKFTAVDYLLKPVIPHELVSALERAERLIQPEHQLLKFSALLNNLSNINKESKRIILSTHDTIQVVQVPDIIRCEADANYTHFYLVNNRHILVSRNLKEYDEMLSGYGFFRVHNSHLVNLYFIVKLDKKDGGSAVLKDGSVIPVSTRKFGDLLSLLGKL